MIVKAQISQWMDSILPRDAMVMSPHFENTGGIFTDNDWQGFANALADAVVGYSNPGENKQTVVTITDAEGTPPVFPVATARRNEGLAPAAGQPREVALCLSYYSQQNRPRSRGRLFLPVVAIGLGGSMALRPTAANRAKVLSFGSLLADAGGADIDWVLWSRMDQVARPVSHSWVDDEWDTVRSRGLRPTTRTLATHSE
jgi:hypothetical protein